MPEEPPSGISRRKFIKTALGGGAGLLLLGPAACTPEFRSRDADWWFVQITDTHNGAEAAQKDLQFVLQDIAETFPQTEFVLTTGDNSEHGWAEELDENREIMEASEFTY
ncbi:MAG: 3',5'-cyclic adenosine monophosphate phosphodiesterase CpdA [Candidatus Marinimicrobia bacterium]|nr:3',5'-cyclic adenosine monophosphate phosphodiesterase CpdA [Candidatus Neomarinimicrobiota bacterium]